MDQPHLTFDILSNASETLYQKLDNSVRDHAAPSQSDFKRLSQLLVETDYLISKIDQSFEPTQSRLSSLMIRAWNYFHRFVKGVKRCIKGLFKIIKVIFRSLLPIIASVYYGLTITTFAWLVELISSIGAISYENYSYELREVFWDSIPNSSVFKEKFLFYSS
jgi:hypothetical protein